MQLNFNEMPNPDEVTSGGVQPGEHKLTIIDAQVIKFNSGEVGLQLTHSVDDSNFKLNYDNYPVATGYGKAKLKALLEAINVIPQGDFDLTIIPPMIKGKSFKVELNYGKAKDGSPSKYLSIVDIKTIKPLEETLSTPNTSDYQYDESNF